MLWEYRRNAYIPRSEYVIDNHNDMIDVEPIQWIGSNFILLKVLQLLKFHGQYTIDELFTTLNAVSDENTNQILYFH